MNRTLENTELNSWLFCRLLLSIVLSTFLLMLLSCNNKNTNSNVKPSTNSGIEKKYFDSLFNQLSLKFHSNNKKGVLQIWDVLLKKKELTIKYLMDFKDDKSRTKWHWITKFPMGKALHTNFPNPTQEIASLYIISALTKKDLFFALSRVLYDENYIDTSRVIEPSEYSLQLINAKKSVSISKIWGEIDSWRKNGYNGDPLKNTSIKWIGEISGKINIRTFRLFPRLDLTSQ